jgi:serine/threonine protein kinase
MLKEGDEFDGLKLLKHCGTGGFGSVFYCEDFSGKKRAVKIISKVQIGASWKRELKGVRIYQRITGNNPELLQIYHVKDDKEYFYYTMEPADPVPSSESYIPDTLAFRLQKKPLPEKELFPVLSKVFQGLKVIHDNGCAHRDIKPENILFVNGIPKLADIGLVSSLTVSMTHMAGTLDYIPPEIRASNDPADTTAQRQLNDLYALGMVIYCAVSGMSPKKFPSLPGNIDLISSPAIKYFSNLAQDLCHPDPQQRISSIKKAEQEFHRIDRILKSGEDWLVKSNYAVDRFNRRGKSVFSRIGMWLSKYSWLVILFIVLTVFLCFHFAVSQKQDGQSGLVVIELKQESPSFIQRLYNAIF